MTTIGDSFAIVALLALLGLTTWALLLIASLLFGQRAESAMWEYTHRPLAGFGTGILILLTWGSLSIVLLNLPNPILKFLGFLGILLPFLVSVIGSAGLCGLIAQRIRDAEPGLSPYAAMVRSSMLVAVAWFFPVLGWFLIAPVILITSLGIGIKSLRPSKRLANSGA